MRYKAIPAGERVPDLNVFQDLSDGTLYVLAPETPDEEAMLDAVIELAEARPVEK